MAIRFLVSLLASLWGVFVLTGCTVGADMRYGMVDTPSWVVGEKVAAQWSFHGEAVERGDPEGAVAIFSENAVFELVGRGEVIRGLFALRQREAERLSAVEVLKARHTINSLDVKEPALAYENGLLWRWVKERATGEERWIGLSFTAQWRRGSDGIWRVHHLAGREQG